MSENIQNNQTATENQQSGLGIAGMIIGIIALLLSCILIGGFIGIIGLILSIIGVSQKNKKTGMAVAGIVLNVIAIIIMIIIFAIAGTDSEKSTSATSTPETQTISSYAQEKTVSSEEANTSKETANGTLHVGDTFDNGSDLYITATSSDLNFTDYDDEYGWYKPESGMKYISVSFTFENNGKNDEYVSIYDFDCYADNTSCEQAFLPDGSDFINTSLSSGRNISFTTYYQVPDNATSIELEYTKSYWSSEKAIISLQ